LRGERFVDRSRGQAAGQVTGGGAPHPIGDEGKGAVWAEGELVVAGGDSAMGTLLSRTSP
jgi:hypothetical protein